MNFFFLKKSKIPDFILSGRIDSTEFCINKPLNGHVRLYFISTKILKNSP